MARLILDSGESTGLSSGTFTIFGTKTGKEAVTVGASANVTFDASFNTGGDTINLAGNASTWTAVRSGSSIVLTSTAGGSVTIPVGTSGASVVFADAPARSLSFNTALGQIELGTQAVGFTAATVAAGTGGSGSTSGQTFTLTTNTDAVPGTAGNDTITGSASTFNSDDTINGGDGTDVFSVTVAAAGTVIGNLTSVETVRVTNGGAATDNYAINMIGAAGATELVSRLSSGDVSFSNVQAAAKLTAYGTVAVTSQLSATFLNSLASGTADSVSLKADGGAAVTFEASGTTTTNVFETVNLESAGGLKNTVELGTTLAGGAKAVNVTGAADLAISLEKTAAKSSYDGSAASGKQTVTVSAGDTGAASLFYVETIKTGSANDTIDLTDLVGGAQNATTFFGSTNPKVIDGGVGTDTLQIAEAFTSLSASNAADGTARKHSIAGIEVIEQKADAAVDLSLLTGAQTAKLNVAANAFGTALRTVTLGAGDDINIAAGIDTTNGLNVVLKDASGTTDNVSVTLSDAGQGKVTIATDASSNAVEAVTVTSAGILAAGNTLSNLSAASTTTLNLAGSAKLAVTTVQLKQPTAATSVVDASSMSGNLTLGAAGVSFKTTATDKFTVKLGSGVNSVNFGATLLSSDSVTGSTGTDTVYVTEGNSQTAVKATLKDVDVLNVTAIANDQVIDTTNFSNVGKIQIVGTATGSEDVEFSKVAAGQAFEVVTSTSGNNAQLVDALTIGVATGVTAANVTLKGADGTSQAALALGTDAGSVSITDAVVDASGYFVNNTVTVSGGALNTLKAVTLSGGGASGVGTTAAFSLATGTNVAVSTVDATALSSNLNINGATLVAGAAVKLGAGNNTVTVAAAQLARDAIVVNGGDGIDTIAATLGDATASVDYRPGATAVEALSLTMTVAGGNGDPFDYNIALTDASGINTIAATLAGTDDNIKVTGASGNVALKLAGSQAAATNVVSVAGATGLTVTNTAAVGATAADLTAADATSVTIKQGNASNIAFDAVTVAAATSVTLGGADKSAAGAAYAGTVAVATLNAAKATSLTVDSTNGKVTVSTVAADKLASVTVTGSQGLDFGLSGATTAALASFDGSAATGAIKIGQAVDFTTSADIKTGSGNDEIWMNIQDFGGVTIDAGSQTTTGADTLKLQGTMSLGLTVIDLSSATDQVTQANGSINAAAQKGFESVDLSALSGSFGANITGSAAANTITGTANADNIVAGGGADTIKGGAGADTINLADGSSIADGDLIDTVILDQTASADTISNFGATDVIQLSKAVYAALGTTGAALTAAEFVSGAGVVAGLDGDDRIAYNTTNGNVYYDADGSGVGAAVLIATLSGAPTVSASNFYIIA